MATDIPGGTLVEQVRDAYARGKLDDWRRQPVIPRTAIQGDALLDKPLSLRDLMQSGALSFKVGNDIIGKGGLTISPRPGGGGTSFDGTFDGFVDNRPTLIVPPTPTDLRASGTFKHVILTWELIEYKNHAYVEVWRSTTNALGTAVMIGTAPGNIYLDEANVSLGVTYFYWVRAVGTAPATSPGAFNAVSGVSGGAGKIGHVDLGPLIVEADNLANAAVQGQHLSAGSIAVGSAAIANGAIRRALIEIAAIDTALIADLAVATAKLADLAATTAKIADLAVTTAKIAFLAVGSANIQDLAVTRAKIAALAVGTAQIEDLSVTNAKVSGALRSDNYNPGVSGWNIDKNTGAAEFGAAAIRGQIIASQIQALNIQFTQLSAVGGAVVSGGWCDDQYVGTFATLTRSVPGSIIDVYVNANFDCALKSTFSGPPAANYEMDVAVQWELWSNGDSAVALIGATRHQFRPFIDALDHITLPANCAAAVNPPGSGDVKVKGRVRWARFVQPPNHDPAWGATGTIIDAISVAHLGADIHMVERKV